MQLLGFLRLTNRDHADLDLRPVFALHDRFDFLRGNLNLVSSEQAKREHRPDNFGRKLFGSDSAVLFHRFEEQFGAQPELVGHAS